MAGPLVSVVTPSLNQGRYLREAIESVRAQTHAPIEHIVVDGGSTDDSVAILREYDDVRWVSEPDRGQSHAVNKGFALATGEVFPEFPVHPAGVHRAGIEHVGADPHWSEFPRGRRHDPVERALGRAIGHVEGGVVAGQGHDGAALGRGLPGKGRDQLPAGAGIDGEVPLEALQ